MSESKSTISVYCTIYDELPYVKLSTSCVLTPAETETLSDQLVQLYCAKVHQQQLFRYWLGIVGIALAGSTSATELRT